MLLKTALRNFSTAKPLTILGKEKLVGGWLAATAAGVFAIILVGGYTRLSGSGLSMVKWTPLLPQSTESWEAEFAEYKRFPQFQLANKDITLPAFKKIYFVEWLHRCIGLGLGVVFAGPLLYFLRKGYLTPRMRVRLLGLLGVGAVQGAVGWWMVKSGLEQKPDYQIRPKVSPYRLSMHLMTATFIFSMLTSSALRLLVKPAEAGADSVNTVRRTRLAAIILLKLVLLNILSGSIVAGIDAGKTYNTWPDMNGAFVPPGLLRRNPKWSNFFENHALVQFNHRNSAYLSLATGWWLFMRTSRGTPRVVRFSAGLVWLLLNYQAILGITNLLNMSQVHTASAHQCVGFLTLTAVLHLLARTRVL